VRRHRVTHEYGFLGWLALPFAFYFIPLFLGFSWNALGGSNPLNPPLPPTEGYLGRTSDLPITAEAWGAAVVNLPFRARLREYIRHHELPLWNPYQGLGQPFAAQGEGSPYFPVAVVRAVLPYSFANYVTFASYYLSSVFLFLFLRGLGISEWAAIFGGIAYALSGALSIHVARENIADQLSMVPILFWSTAKAMRERRVVWYAVLSVVSALNALAGFIQIAMLAGAVLIVFCVVYGWSISTSRPEYVREILTTSAAFVLGNGLAAFELLPMIHAFYNDFSKNGPSMRLPPLPIANLFAFFFPSIFGFPLQGREAHPSPLTVDWSNLFGFSGVTLLLLTIVGTTVCQWRTHTQRGIFFFFTLGALFLMLRYLSIPPFVYVNLLPILGMQTPKHATGIIVFCLIIAAALSVDHVDRWNIARGRRLITAIFLSFLMVSGLLLTHEILIRWRSLAAFISRNSAFFLDSASFLFATLILSLLSLYALWLSGTQAKRSAEAAQIVLIGAVIAELSIYIPLGTDRPDLLYVRIGLGVLIFIAVRLLVLGRWWLAGGLLAAILVGYAWAVAAPTKGLPRQFEADQPAPYMRWLKRAAGTEYRTFGIFPDFSSLARVQDLSVVGPLSPPTFLSMVRVLGDPSTIKTFETSTEFMLAGRRDFPLEQYWKTKAIFDWLGIRYLVFDHVYFHPGARVDEIRLMSNRRDFRVAYQDNRVTILESIAAQPKAIFSADITIVPTERDILARLKSTPVSVLGAPMVATDAIQGAQIEHDADLPPASVSIDSYTPTLVRVAAKTPTGGIVVLKDADSPGWKATVNGIPARIIRVNGMVRGVTIPHGGIFVVQFLYRPDSFILGLRLAGLTGLIVLAGVIWEGWRGPH